MSKPGPGLAAINAKRKQNAMEASLKAANLKNANAMTTIAKVGYRLRHSLNFVHMTVTFIAGAAN